MKFPSIFQCFIVCSLSFQLISTQLDSGMILDLICRAKCMKIFKIEASTNYNNDVNKTPFLIESFCLKDSKCKGCTAACSRHDNSLDVCKQNCKVLAEDSSQYACMDSCQFIESKKLDRPGICPLKVSHPKCSYPCQSDSDCFKQGTKCCKNSYCGGTCQIANLDVSGVPPIPGAPFVRQIIDRKDRDQIKFDLDWSTYDIASVDYPVIFLVQVRVGQLMSHRKEVQGGWRDMISTTKSGVIISAIDPENWYQFRLLAFSQNGYKQEGNMTSPITVQYKPTHPVPPKNVAEKVSRLVDKHISVTMTWQPGESNSLIPISNYKINWRRFNDMYESSPLFPEYEIIIPATEIAYTIQDLQPATTYKIQITSVVIYKGVKYNSSATVHYITTSSIPSRAPQPQTHEESPIATAGLNGLDNCACGNSYQQLPVVINNATMVNGQLSMLVRLKDTIEFDNTFAPYSFRIQWYPTACIESNSWRIDSQISEIPKSIVVNDYINHYITGLRMQCTYNIDVELFSQLAKKKIKIWDGCFCTPSCTNTNKVNDGMMNLCPRTDQFIPPAPNNIRILILKSDHTDSTSNAELVWDSNPPTYITGYRITYGPRLEEPIDEPMYSKDLLPILDSARATSKVIKYPHQSVILRNLEVGKIYVVKLQSINNQLSSQESVLFFKVHFDKNSASTRTGVEYGLLLLCSWSILAIAALR